MTRTSDTYRYRSLGANRENRKTYRKVIKGFSLLEVLVVLAIIGGLVGLVVPGISKWLEVSERNKTRGEVLTGLESLSFEAYRSGKTIELAGKLSPNSPALSSLPLQLPAGWDLQFNRPVQWHYTGVCTGGEVELLGPNQWRELIKLLPPHCLVSNGVL